MASRTITLQSAQVLSGLCSVICPDAIYVEVRGLRCKLQREHDIRRYEKTMGTAYVTYVR